MSIAEHHHASAIAAAQQIAESILGPVHWNGADGYCRCVAGELHTTGMTPRDLHVVVEPLPSGVKPGVYCFHQGCRAACEAVSRQLRRALGSPQSSPIVFRSRPPHSPKVTPSFDAAKLADFAAARDGVDEDWLAERSPKCVFNRTPASFLHDLYLPGEKVVIFDVFASQGQALWACKGPPFDARELDGFRTGRRLGVWFLANPVNGEARPNDSGRSSRRSWQNVTSYRYAVLESDQANPSHWLAALVQLPIPIAAITTSGGKSIHALVRIDAESKAEWDEIIRRMKPGLITLGVDASALTAVRLTRLPCCERLGSMDKTGGFCPYDRPRMQRLLYLNPNPTVAPIARKEAR